CQTAPPEVSKRSHECTFRAGGFPAAAGNAFRFNGAAGQASTLPGRRPRHHVESINMIYSGKAVSAQLLDDGIAELKFDLQGESVNKFNRETIEDLGKAVEALKADGNVKGVIVTSGKGVFIVGADITEFTEMFKLPEDEIAGWCLSANQVFNAVEDLPFPTVCAVNGIALGGGLEMALSCDFRVAASSAQVGLPEVKLGLFPGFGGTVRLPRLIGVDNAVEWIAAGGQHKTDKALKDGVLDAVVEADKLKDA